jgi:hypothetical protein
MFFGFGPTLEAINLLQGICDRHYPLKNPGRHAPSCRKPLAKDCQRARERGVPSIGCNVRLNQILMRDSKFAGREPNAPFTYLRGNP